MICLKKITKKSQHKPLFERHGAPHQRKGLLHCISMQQALKSNPTLSERFNKIKNKKLYEKEMLFYFKLYDLTHFIDTPHM